MQNTINTNMILGENPLKYMYKSIFVKLYTSCHNLIYYYQTFSVYKACHSGKGP